MERGSREGKQMEPAAEDRVKEEDDDFSGGDEKKKRGGAVGGSSRGCQADKCGADLTAAKPYHRRHKVCEHHSKAAAVVVAGIRQRFCQQCSRFHKLSEFDESKRSCRRRLAGHNERRRKSSGDAETSSSHRGLSPQLRDIVFGGQIDDRGTIQMTKHFQIR